MHPNQLFRKQNLSIHESKQKQTGIPYRQSNELDENGRPFVLASDGTTIFGKINEETGLIPAPIKLSEGTKDYGLLHIESRHGQQIKQSRFKSIIEFVENVAQNYTDIKEGKVRNRNKTYIIEVSDKYNNTLFVELSQDGSYWNVNSADVFRKKYSQGKKSFGLLPKCRISNRLLMILCGHKGIPIPILPQTELYPKWYMPKIAKNPQIYKKRIIKIAILSDIKAERDAIMAEQTAAQQEYDYWNNVKTLLNRQDVNTTEQTAEDGNETHKNGIRLTAEEVVDLLSQMEETAEVAPELSLTPENWAEIFGENNSITTPVGQVKMGDNQINKFFAKGREKSFGMVAPTLSNPDVVIEKDAQSPNAERNTKYLFIKTFIKSDGSRYVHFETVTVRKDGMEVSISSHEVDRKVAKKEMQNGIILHLNNKLSLDSERYLIETQNDGRPDLVPTSDNNISKSQGNVFAPITEDTNVSQFNFPTYKYSKKNPIIRERREKNAQEEERAEQQLYPTDEAGEPLWYEMTEKQFDVAMTELGDDADAFNCRQYKRGAESHKKSRKGKTEVSRVCKAQSRTAVHIRRESCRTKGL